MDGGDSAKAYLDGVLKDSVTAAMKSCVSTGSDNALGYIAQHLETHNPSRKVSTFTVELNDTVVEFVDSRLDTSSRWHFLHPTVPLIAERDASREDIYKMINTVRDTALRRLNERAKEETLDPRTANMAGMTDADVAPPSVTPPTRIKLIFVAPVNKNILFVEGHPVMAGVAEQLAASLEHHPEHRASGADSASDDAGRSNTHYSDIEDAGSDWDDLDSSDSGPLAETLPFGQAPPPVVDRHPQVSRAAPKVSSRLGKMPPKLSSRQPSIAKNPGNLVPVARTAAPSTEARRPKRKPLRHIDLEAALSKAVAVRSSAPVTTVREMGDNIAKVFSTSGLVIESYVIHVPLRHRISLDTFERFDELVGISDAAEVVPTVLALYGMREYMMSNMVSILLAVMLPLQEVADFHHNRAVERKRVLDLKASQQRNEWRLVNASAYWAIVRQRRESRDKIREQMQLDMYKRPAQPPLPSGATDEERSAWEQKRRAEEEARQQALTAFEDATHKARIARQARRSREDVAAAEVLKKQALSSGLVIQAVVRGFLVRRRIRERLNRLREERRSSLSSVSLSSTTPRSGRSKKQAIQTDVADDATQFLLERRIVRAMLTAYPELLTLKTRDPPRPPRSYTNWVPKRRRIPPVFDGDVSSEAEEWEVETIIVPKRLPMSRYRLMNPIERLRTVLDSSRCGLSRYIDGIATQFSNISTLQRQGYIALQTKMHHLLHLIYLELTHRQELQPAGCSFSYFVHMYYPQIDEWFTNPLAINESMMYVAQVTGGPASSIPPATVMDRNKLLVFDSGFFDVRTVHKPVQSTPRETRSSGVTPRVEALRTPAFANQAQASRTSDVVTTRSVEGNEQQRPVTGSLDSPSKLTSLAESENDLPMVRLRESALYCCPDGINVDAAKSLIDHVARGGAMRVMWIQTTEQSMVFVDRKPFFLTRRLEQQTVPGRPGFRDFTAMTQIVTTNNDAAAAVTSPPRRRSFTRSPAVVGVHPRGSIGSSSSGGTGSANPQPKVPFSPQPVPESADRRASTFRDVPMLEVEERLRAEVLTQIDRADGSFTFLGHRSLTTSGIMVTQSNTSGGSTSLMIADPFKFQVDGRTTIPSGVVSSRGPQADVMEEYILTVAVPKKDPPVRASIASRPSMYSSGDNVGSSRDLRELASGSQTPRAFGNGKSGTKSMRYVRQSVGSKSDSITDAQLNEPHDGRTSLSGVPVLPDLDALPLIVQSPQKIFDDVLSAFPLAERKFVRMPLSSCWGYEWLQRLSQLCKMTYTYLSEPGALIMSITDESSLFYVAIVDVMNVILLERRSTLITTPQESPATLGGSSADPVFASIRVPRGSVGLFTQSMEAIEATHSSKVAKKIPEPDRVFGSILALDAREPDLQLRKAMRVLNRVLDKSGLGVLRDRVVLLKQRAEAAAGHPECRTFVRECCCALERYVWLVFFTSITMRSAQEGLYACPDILDAVLHTPGGRSIERLVATIDPWATQPRSSPDPFHVSLYSGGADRWKPLYFVQRMQ